ncbi:hypothetical protein HNV12_01550 [Methanococcoides sp. SA1]|nr:hypothetical protein [Methanococcoides sp. SA1]
MGDDEFNLLSDDAGIFKKAERCAREGDGRGMLGYLNRTECCGSECRNLPVFHSPENWKIFGVYLNEGIDAQVEEIKKRSVNRSGYEKMVAEIKVAYECQDYTRFVFGVKNLLVGGISLESIMKNAENRGRLW